MDSQRSFMSESGTRSIVVRSSSELNILSVSSLTNASRKTYDNYVNPIDLKAIDIHPLLTDDNDTNSKKFKYPKIPPPYIEGLPEIYGRFQWFQKKEIPVPSTEKQIVGDALSYGAIIEDKPVDENGVREAFIRYANSNMCYGTGCASTCILENLNSSNSARYTFETYTEKRFVTLTVKPYNGMGLHHPSEGIIPEPWDVDLKSDSIFVDCTKETIIPFTEQYMKCYRCWCMGYLLCSQCSGISEFTCTVCKGSMFDPNIDDYKTCPICKGTGLNTCSSCKGQGAVKCNVCNGQANLKSCLVLEVEYKNNKDDYVVNHKYLTDEDVIEEIGVEVLLEQTHPKLKPLQCQFANNHIIENALKIYVKHAEYFQYSNCVMQRQKLEAITVTEAEYNWKNMKSKVWVYGKHKNVYCPDYPQKSCCSIM